MEKEKVLTNKYNLTLMGENVTAAMQQVYADHLWPALNDLARTMLTMKLFQQEQVW